VARDESGEDEPVKQVIESSSSSE
jgi:hypothetical protein